MKLHALIICFFFFLLLFLPPRPTSSETETDRQVLSALKNQLSENPSGILSSWNGSVDFCSWEGISCHRRRVSALSLRSHGLKGRLPPAIANLTALQRLDLSSNGFFGEIPPAFGNLHNLQLLNLSLNSINGRFPANLTRCSELRVLDLSNNQLTGEIPSQISSLMKLIHLDISRNSVTGIIPPLLSNLSSLQVLNLGQNLLHGGIPSEFGRFPRLSSLILYSNRLSGAVPPLNNISSLQGISLVDNRLSGSLSALSSESLPNLQFLFMGGNQLNGSLLFLSNFTSLVELDMGANNFSGKVPLLGKNKGLSYVNLEENELEGSGEEDWKFIDSMANCSNMQVFNLDTNELMGILPRSIGNLSTQLQTLALGYNQISGIIPSEIENLVGLTLLAMEFNSLSGFIPKGIGRLKMLQKLSFGSNNLSGTIPPSMGNLTELIELDMGDNSLTGSVPVSLGNLQKLDFFSLGFNNLTGSLPKEIFTISSLSQYLGLSHNSFEGFLPPEVGNLMYVTLIDVSYNQLSGKIPQNLGSCKMLSTLYIQSNFIEGNIPLSLRSLEGLQKLDISSNNLSGAIPDFLQDLKALNLLNLSFNHLKGEVPVNGIFRNASAVSLVGNDNVCGGVSELNLPKCVLHEEATGQEKKFQTWYVVIIFAAFLLAFAILLAFVFMKQKWRLNPSSYPSSFKAAEVDSILRVSLGELAKATNDFSSGNLIGRGRSGSVYKGTLGKKKTNVAIKVFNPETHEASKSFAAECAALRSIRHRNVVKVLTSCSSIDSRGNDFRALVLELVPMGDLRKWLHGKEEEEQLDKNHRTNGLSLIQRLNITVDVADALEYLHHSCQPPIIHGDIKPCNVLLDDDMSARIADFGLAVLLPEAPSNSSTDACVPFGIKGTIGYVPPEYGVGSHPSTSGDVYSFGILLLEILTGRSPVDDKFEGLSLHEFVETAISDRILEIVDERMLVDERIIVDEKMSECFISVARVGLLCSQPLPDERMSMREAATEMHAIRDAYLRCSGAQLKI
ncbi:putative LRR receptor-like serine/threonine-protein kinase [Apostasia shenzhenica]|uniref:Receptor kinase-like protein Xa21 n=1 Tax=Apostasia shenzhenica TaxID=1088818 RepID=A0A2I0AEA7_9ASPA|nr:putative LRR receptor-like serine/threonine-protein kinase [Apostasia shenzhenica]